MNIFQKTTPIDAAAESVRTTLAARPLIKEALAGAKRELDQARANLAGVRGRLDLAEAEAALASQPTAPKARRELLEHQLDVEAGEARVRGLAGKLTENTALLREKRVSFEQTRRAYNREKLEAFRPTYMKAVIAFAAATRQLVALGEALGEDRFSGSGSENCAMFGDEFVLMPIDPKDHPEGYRRHEGFYPVWAGDKAAATLHAEHAGPAKVFAELQRAVDMIQSEEAEEKRLAAVPTPALRLTA